MVCYRVSFTFLPYSKQFNFDKFKYGRAHEEHAAATWNSGHFLEDRGEIKKTCVELAGRRTFTAHVHF
jgi:hypothetical protein